MTDKERFSGFDFNHNPYEDEARERWGNKTVDDVNAILEKKSTGDLNAFQEEFNQIFFKLAEVRNEQPDSNVAQARIHEWYVFLNTFGSYSKEAFKGLGELYIADERFTKNIDQFGEGLAEFMCEAMAVYVERLDVE